MSYIKKSILFPICFFFVLLVCFVAISYKGKPYVINIQYQSQKDSKEDGVEKIIVSHVQGIRSYTAKNFEYHAEKDRYEYEINKLDNAYLNLYLDPSQTFQCHLEYRLRYEDSIIDQSDGIAVTLYSGQTPVSWEFFSLIDRGTDEKYQIELYGDFFIALFLISFVLSMTCALKFVQKKTIVGGVITGIWCFLWLWGMQVSALSEKTVFNRFAVLFVFLMILSVVFNLIRNVIFEGKGFAINTAKRIIPSILFLAITCCVYIPSSLFLGNINEFVMPYHRIADLIFLYAIVSIVVLFAIGLSIRGVKGQYIYSLILFFLTMGFYVQSNFLNPTMSDLNGEAIDWDQFANAKVSSYIGWGILCIILLVLICLVVWKNIKIEKLVRYLAGLFSLMQMCSFVVMVITCRMDPGLCRTMGKDGQFTIGEENIIVFVVDCLQADAVQTYIENAAEAETALQDFTFFTNTVGGGAPTKYAIPLMLTGEEYDLLQEFSDYQDEIWQEGYLLKDLAKENYDVRLYTDADLLRGIPSEQVQNIYETSGNTVGNKILFGQRMLQLSNLYMMPLPLKGYFWLDTDDLKDCLVVNDSMENTSYEMNDIHFYEEFERNHLQKQTGKKFRFYHLRGVHKPYRHDERFRPVGNNETDEERTFRGVMMLLQEYMDEMRKLGVYDNSTIVILGDHGRHNPKDAEKYPAILVKRAGESHALQYSDNPVCFRNLVATIGSEIKKDYTQYGPSLYDVDQKSDVQRLQTMNRKTATKYAGYDGELYADSNMGVRFVVDDDGEGNLTYREWNPYEINRILYNYGDVIDFRSSGSYADSLTERLYPAENGKTASNELTICFDLPEQKTGDLEFGFSYVGVYNDTQKIRIYANGHKVDNIMCTTDQIGKETSVVIPKQFVKEKPVIIRMVFPNALTPNQLDRSNEDMRVLSVTFDKMWLKVANS